MVALLLLVATVPAAFLLRSAPLRRWAMVPIIVAFTVGSVSVVSLPRMSTDDTYYVGVASPIPRLTLTTLMAITACILGLLSTPQQRKGGKAFLALTLFLGAGLLGVWDVGDTAISGMIHLFAVTCAFIAGRNLWQYFWVYGEAPLLRRSMIGLLIVSLLLFVPAWYQWGAGTGAEGYGDRVGGAFSIPATIGKIAILVAALSLPLVKSSDTLTRRFAMATSAFAILSVLPTLSRANTLGILILFGVWALYQVRKWGLFRLTFLAVVLVIIAIPFARILETRMAADPDGGDRPELLAAALRVIPEYLWFGLGPNNYVFRVQNLEAIVASTGYPVHNSFFLLLAETGVVGLFLVLIVAVLPLVIGIFRGLKYSRLREYSFTAIGLISGSLPILLTGWGGLREPVLELGAFVVGVYISVLNDSFTTNEEPLLDKKLIGSLNAD